MGDDDVNGTRDMEMIFGSQSHMNMLLHLGYVMSAPSLMIFHYVSISWLGYANALPEYSSYIPPDYFGTLLNISSSLCLVLFGYGFVGIFWNTPYALRRKQ